MDVVFPLSCIFILTSCDYFVLDPTHAGLGMCFVYLGVAISYIML